MSTGISLRSCSNVAALNIRNCNESGIAHQLKSLGINLEPLKPHCLIISNLNFKTAGRFVSCNPVNDCLVISQHRLRATATLFDNIFRNIRRVRIQPHTQRSIFSRKLLQELHLMFVIHSCDYSRKVGFQQ